MLVPLLLALPSHALVALVPTTVPRTTPVSCVVRGVGEGRDLPSPSGINTLDEPLQAAVVGALTVGLGALTVAIAGPGFDSLRGSFLWELSRPTWPLLGLIYLAAGIAHFTEAEGFTNITPPNGSWGFWWTPFSPKVNTLWTGVVDRAMVTFGTLLSVVVVKMLQAGSTQGAGADERDC